MAWTFVLDGIDISNIASGKSWTRRLNRPSSASCRIPGHLADVTVGISKLKVYDGGTLRFHGVVWRVDDAGDEDKTYTEFTAYDPMIYWPKRIARDIDGDYSNPDFIERYTTAPLIMESIINRSIDYEGGMKMSVGTLSTGGPALSGKPTDWPQTLDDIRKLLVDTGWLDIVVEPTESPSTIATVDLYNGSYPQSGGYGSDLTATVNFGYGTGLNNVRKITRSEDMSTVCNKLRFLLGGRKGVPADPKGAQHWKADVQRDDGCLPGNPGDFTPPIRDCTPGPGVGGQPGTPLGILIDASRSDYDELQEVRIYDAEGSYLLRESYYRIWQNESIVRARPRTLVTITPVRGTPLTFDHGDLITVQAGSVLRGGFSGVQRVYSFTVNIDDEGVADLGELVASADQEL